MFLLLARDAFLRRASATHDTIVRMVALLGTLLIVIDSLFFKLVRTYGA